MRIIVKDFDAVYDKLEADESIEQELYDYFSYQVPNYYFMKKRNPRLKAWDGMVHLYSKRSKKIYVGLRSRLEQFAQDRGYEVEYASPQNDAEYSLHEAKAFIDTLNLPQDRYPRDYQIKSFVQAVRKQRLLVLSPTASGKSLFLYLLIRHYGRLSSIRKVLLIVPTLNLVHQIQSDFVSYGWNAEYTHLVYSGQDKSTNKPVTISTWQSLYEMPKDFFNNFDVIIIDEAHHAQANSIKRIMEAATGVTRRIGCTGTLNDSLTHRLILEGLFGPVYQATTTKELMNKKYLSELKIKAIVLKYDEATSKHVCKLDYASEIEYLSLHESRNRFIKNLTLSLDNVLILFRLVEKHGKTLYQELKQATNRPVYFIAGEVDGEERERIRTIFERQGNAILVGSYGTVSTGINIPSLKNIIFASPYKSRIKVLQSIGRGLRRTDLKQHITVYDIADDCSYKKKHNFTLDHYIERVKIYNEEDFEYKQYRIDLK